MTDTPPTLDMPVDVLFRMEKHPGVTTEVRILEAGGREFLDIRDINSDGSPGRGWMIRRDHPELQALGRALAAAMS